MIIRISAGEHFIWLADAGTAKLLNSIAIRVIFLKTREQSTFQIAPIFLA